MCVCACMHVCVRACVYTDCLTGQAQFVWEWWVNSCNGEVALPEIRPSDFPFFFLQKTDRIHGIKA